MSKRLAAALIVVLAVCILLGAGILNGGSFDFFEPVCEAIRTALIGMGVPD